ncbi:MAG: anthranilate synthase component I [Actinomycetes bacterium]
MNSAEAVYQRRAHLVDGRTVPTQDEFAALAAQRRVVPVLRRLLADGETPIGLYRKLARNRPGTYLLESAEHGRVWSRYSFVGVRCSAMLTQVDGSARWVGTAPIPSTEGPDGDSRSALDVLRDTVAALRSPRIPGLPPLTSGLVGMIGYDAVRQWERLPELTHDDLQLPDLAMLLASDLAVLDHHDGSVMLIANALIDADDEDPDSLRRVYADAVARLDAMSARLSEPVPATASSYDIDAVPDFVARTDPQVYREKVEVVRDHIYSGDAFQVVLSQRFEATTQADALDIYRILRINNPSPYMYLFRFPSADGVADADPTLPGLGTEVAFEVIGSSPEALVKLEDGRAMVHPLAGTRHRGATPERDNELAEELLADEKERAEHLMLVDLGRNDLGRVCVPGSVEVIEFMAVERYSHVMHIVSTVVGQIRDDRVAYDLLAATFPAGTLSGAPKPRAMEIIETLETTRRGLYGGAVGYLDFAGDMDTAIAIRTAVLRDGVAYIQAGAGLVADSDPAAEEAECRNKAAAVLRAVAIAGTLARAGEPRQEATR